MPDAPARITFTPLKQFPRQYGHPILQVKKLRLAVTDNLLTAGFEPDTNTDSKAVLFPAPGNAAAERQRPRDSRGEKQHRLQATGEVGAGQQHRWFGESLAQAGLQPLHTRGLQGGGRGELTSRSVPADRGRRRASASGTWATHRRPGRRACSSTPLCSGASLAGRQEEEGGHLTSCPPPCSCRAHRLPWREEQATGPAPSPPWTRDAPPDDNCISLIISMI